MPALRPLEVAAFDFRFRARAPMRMPGYMGSAWRGGFGRALRRAVCGTGLPICPGCPLEASCVVEERARRDAEDRWNTEERDAAREIAAVRNDIEHAGFKNQPGAAETLQKRLGKLVEDFAALPSPAARV